MTEKTDRKTLLEWAEEAKGTAEAGDLDPMPRDESFIRAAVTFHMLTREPMPYMQLPPDRDPSDTFNRSSAIVLMAINFDDDEPSTPQRARLFAEALGRFRDRHADLRDAARDVRDLLAEAIGYLAAGDLSSDIVARLIAKAHQQLEQFGLGDGDPDRKAARDA